MSFRRLAPCVLIQVLCPVLSYAQASKQSEPEVVTHQAPATFSSRVNLVSVPVVVRDKDGHAVGGLKQDDFQLFDKGKPQVITKFTVQTSAPGSKPAVAAADAPVASTAAEPGEAPGKPALPDRYVAYFFDDIHMKPEDLLNARKAASHHLDTAFDPGMRAGVFTTSGRTTLAFTDDVAKLHDTINRIQPWTPIDDKTACLQISYYIADVLVNREQSLSPVLGINASSPLALAIFNEAAVCAPKPTTPDDVVRLTRLAVCHINLTTSSGVVGLGAHTAASLKMARANWLLALMPNTGLNDCSRLTSTSAM